MTAPDPLQECLLGLHAALGESVPLIIAGGYGLYLKQRSIVHSGLRTLFRLELLPDNRTTHDIDLFLQAKVVVSANRMKLVRDAVDGLGFAAEPRQRVSAVRQTSGARGVDQNRPDGGPPR